MKLATIQLDELPVYGRVDGDELVIPDNAYRQQYPALVDVLAAGAASGMQAAGESQRVSLESAEYLSPLPNPTKVICVGVNYLAHMREMGRPEPEYPLLFTRYADTLVGHGQKLLRPRNSTQYDFEGELAFVIGRQAHHVAKADALDYVAGYTCFMDGSLRDYQHHTTQIIAGKNFWRSGACGPWLVTADEIPDPSVLKLQTRLNGDVMQEAPVSDIKFDIPYLVEYISSFCPLSPGDIISTGTPSGVGYGREPQLWMQPGDVIEVDIDGIGILRNPIVAETVSG